MNNTDSLNNLQKYSDLQTKLITLLEIENYIAQHRVVVEEEMEQLKIILKSRLND